MGFAIGSGQAAWAVGLSAVSGQWAGRYLYNDQFGAQADLSHEGFGWARLQGGLTLGFRDFTPIGALDLNIGPDWRYVAPFAFVGGTFALVKAWSTALHVGGGVRSNPYRGLIVSAEVTTLPQGNTGLIYGGGIGWAL